MPIDLSERDHDDTIDIRPGTNKARVIRLLYRDTDLGYTPSEIREALEIPSGSVSTTLSRLRDEGYISKTEDGLYHGLEQRDDVRRFAASLTQLDRLFDRHPEASVDPEDVDQTGDTPKRSIPEERLQREDTPVSEPEPEDWIGEDDV